MVMSVLIMTGSNDVIHHRIGDDLMESGKLKYSKLCNKRDFTYNTC